MDLSDYISSGVLSKIKKQFSEAVSSAVDSYEDLRADEDSVTGALSQSIKSKVNGENGNTTWKTRVRKVRGRGKNAPEKSTGIDSVLEIEVFKQNKEFEECVFRKFLPIQAKNGESSNRKKLKEQADNIESHGGGIIVTYGPDKFFACSARSVSEADGKISDGALRPLDHVISDDFLGCKIGIKNVPAELFLMTQFKTLFRRTTLLIRLEINVFSSKNR